jgi:transposase
MMTTGFSRACRIWLAQHRVDFRKQHSGLLAEAYKMALDPFAGDVIIFIGRTRRMLKVLYADPTGLIVTSKLFTVETMKTKFKFISEPLVLDITRAELSLLMEGSRYTIEKKVATYTKNIDRKRSAMNSPPSSSEKAASDESSIARRVE